MNGYEQFAYCLLSTMVGSPSVNERNWSRELMDLGVIGAPIDTTTTTVTKELDQETKNQMTTYLGQETVVARMLERNFYKNRYRTNNDVFVFVSALNEHQTKYWLKLHHLLSTLSFEHGYIVSTSYNVTQCEARLQCIAHFRMKTLYLGPVETIMIAMTCPNVVVSEDVFSWTLGVLCKTSKIHVITSISSSWPCCDDVLEKSCAK